VGPFYLITIILIILQWHNAQHPQGGIVQQAGQQTARHVVVVPVVIAPHTQARPIPPHIRLLTLHQGRIAAIPAERLDHVGREVVQVTVVVQ
jgi:hypothetical protein